MLSLFQYSIHCRSVTTEYVAIHDNFVCINSFRCPINAAIVVLRQLCINPMLQLLQFFLLYFLDKTSQHSLMSALLLVQHLFESGNNSRAALILYMYIHVTVCYMFVNNNNIIDFLYLLHLICYCSVYLRAVLFCLLHRFVSHLFVGSDNLRVVSCMVP